MPFGFDIPGFSSSNTAQQTPTSTSGGFSGPTQGGGLTVNVAAPGSDISNQGPGMNGAGDLPPWVWYGAALLFLGLAYFVWKRRT
jgi:hypothetical protein